MLLNITKRTQLFKLFHAGSDAYDVIKQKKKKMNWTAVYLTGAFWDM